MRSAKTTAARKIAHFKERIAEGVGGTGGIIIARSAADDLSVGVGDTVQLTHPPPQGTRLVIATPPVQVMTCLPRQPAYQRIADDRSLQMARNTQKVGCRADRKW